MYLRRIWRVLPNLLEMRQENERSRFTPQQGLPAYQEWVRRGPLPLVHALVSSAECKAAMKECKQYRGFVSRLHFWARGVWQIEAHPGLEPGGRWGNRERQGEEAVRRGG